MNLPLAFKIIAQVETHPHGFLKVCGSELAGEVHRMAEAGLVKEAASKESDPAEAVITEVTHAGHQFYRALRNVRAFSRN